MDIFKDGTSYVDQSIIIGDSDGCLAALGICHWRKNPLCM